MWHYDSATGKYYPVYGDTISDTVVDTASDGFEGTLSLGFAQEIMLDNETSWIWYASDSQWILIDSYDYTSFSGRGSMFNDSIYCDDSTKSMWVASCYNNFLSFMKGTSEVTLFTCFTTGYNFASSDFDFTGKTGISFAVQGNILYFSYLYNNVCYLQRADISYNIGEDGHISGYNVTLVGSAMSTEQLGFSGVVTDIVILYDGTVYALVSNTGNTADANENSFEYVYTVTNTFYSRGALLKIETTSSGFEVVDSLGWTENPRTVSPVGEVYFGEDTQLQPQTAYIPPYTQRETMFYGPRRFVAIRPKELAIADCGMNFVMPDAVAQKNGKAFMHNRVVTVSLYDFAVSSVKDLQNIKFFDLALTAETAGGAGISSGVYIIGTQNGGDEYDNNIEEES